MIAEVIEKGDATFTIKYKAENGQEAMIIQMMAMKCSHVSYLMAGPDTITVPSVHVAVLETLSKKWTEAK